MITYTKNKVYSIFLLLILLPPTITCMELITTNTLNNIKSLKRKRDEFTKELTTKYHSVIGTIYDPTARYFYPIYNAGPQENIYKRVTKNNSSRLPLLVDIRMEEYSALGMIIMANKLPPQKKRTAVEKLIPLGFTPTPKDKKAAFLQWWEQIPFEQMTLIHYAAKHNLGIIPELPDELIALITLITVDQKKPLL